MEHGAHETTFIIIILSTQGRKGGPGEPGLKGFKGVTVSFSLCGLPLFYEERKKLLSRF